MAYLILVIEDEPDAAAAIVRALKHGGYRAITAADAAEGLERVRSERPDLILLDLVLGDRDGMEVCSEIREHSEVHRDADGSHSRGRPRRGPHPRRR